MIEIDLATRVGFILKVADDNLIMAQRLGELISRLAELEEDIAIANISLDHLGQARSLYTYAAQLEDAVHGEDDLAMNRDERQFHNAVLVEQPNGDFAHVMARQLLVDAYQVPFFGALAHSDDETLAGIAAKAEKEARYHLEHSRMWVIRLGDGTDTSHERMQSAVEALWRFSADLFEPTAGEDDLVAAGIAVDPGPVRGAFDETIRTVLDSASLRLPDDPYQRIGGRVGNHTEYLGHVLAEMQWLHRSHPGANW